MNDKHRASILVVDDNMSNLQYLVGTLKAGDYKIATARDGQTALEFIERKKTDLVLLDIMMPGMDGYEVCRRIRELESGDNIPVIFISALSDIPEKVKGFEVGGVDYITKPFRKEEVLARISVHLNLKKAREELEAANESLKTANATREKIISIIAHDLRGPFGSLEQGLELVRDSREVFSTDKEKNDFLYELSKIAGKATELLDNLLCWARTRGDKSDLVVVEMELFPVIQSNFELFASMADQKSIRVISDVGPGTYVYADPDMLMTVIRNLLSNAIKFTEKGGEILVSAVPSGDFVDISVKDTGVGIDDENIGSLFQIDTHFTTFGTEKEKGSGLGLLLCKEFVEKMGGTIRVKSRIGKGSTFSFTLRKFGEKPGRYFDTEI